MVHINYSNNFTLVKISNLAQPKRHITVAVLFILRYKNEVTYKIKYLLLLDDDVSSIAFAVQSIVYKDFL